MLVIYCYVRNHPKLAKYYMTQKQQPWFLWVKNLDRIQQGNLCPFHGKPRSLGLDSPDVSLTQLGLLAETPTWASSSGLDFPTTWWLESKGKGRVLYLGPLAAGTKYHKFVLILPWQSEVWNEYYQANTKVLEWCVFFGSFRVESVSWAFSASNTAFLGLEDLPSSSEPAESLPSSSGYISLS